jgi:hypothetical protein
MIESLREDNDHNKAHSTGYRWEAGQGQMSYCAEHYHEELTYHNRRIQSQKYN